MARGMRTNAGAASKRIAALGTLIQDNVRMAVADTAISLAEDAAEATPIDTGAAESAWNATPNRPDYITETDSRANDTHVSSVDAVVSRAETNVGQMQSVVAVTNGVSYIETLNQGSSNQAPAGFVQKAVSMARSRINKIRPTRKNGGKLR
jgi:hypothetical protein